MLRTIPPSCDPNVVAAIDQRLVEIRISEGASIPLAIESGSRAWGFPSPDCDYDSRFVYARRMEDYLSPWPKRDVIETPLDGLLDVNGWDLRKALQLLLKGNAVILEWLQSPIHYGVDPWFRDRFLALGHAVADRPMVIRHYLHTALRQRELHLTDPAQVKTKRLLYVLRPLLALRWLQLRSDAAVPPMHFQTLMRQTDLPPALNALLLDLLEEKMSAGEKAYRPLPTLLGQFIETELGLNLVAPRVHDEEYRRALAKAFLVEVLDRMTPVAMQIQPFDALKQVWSRPRAQ